MSDKTALIVGATGLIGKQLLKLLLASEDYNHIIAIIREGSDFSINHPKLECIEINFDELEIHHKHLKANDVFCCLGTTMDKAGSKEHFRKVDFHYPYELARIVKNNGARQYHLISALGADKNSRIFYNKVKGEIEDAIKQLEFNAYHIYRPSLLMGKRQEMRSGEDAGKVFFNLFGFLFIGPLKKYRAIDSGKVAKAMSLYASINDKSGVIIHESEELQEF